MISFLAFASLALSALVAMPVSTMGYAVDKRAADLPLVIFCTNTDFIPFCGEFEPQNGVCQNFGPDLDNLVKSVDMEEGTTCVVFDGDDCTGTSNFVGSPNANLGGIANTISSFECSGP